jgi:addiction module HigA family antidote
MIMTPNGLSSIHPGEFLAEILENLGMSQAEFARAIDVSPMRVLHVIKGSRPVTAELALLFGRSFDQTPQYWLNLQADYDLKNGQGEHGTSCSRMIKTTNRHSMCLI